MIGICISNAFSNLFLLFLQECPTAMNAVGKSQYKNISFCWLWVFLLSTSLKAPHWCAVARTKGLICPFSNLLVMLSTFIAAVLVCPLCEAVAYQLVFVYKEVFCQTPCEGWASRGHGHPLQGQGGRLSYRPHAGLWPWVETCKLTAKKDSPSIFLVQILIQLMKSLLFW